MDYLRKKFDTWKRETLGQAPRSGEFLERYVRYMHESLIVRSAQTRSPHGTPRYDRDDGG